MRSTLLLLGQTTACNKMAGELHWILIISVLSLVGIIWLVHRQHRLARNQVKIAAMLEDVRKPGSGGAQGS